MNDWLQFPTSHYSVILDNLYSKWQDPDTREEIGTIVRLTMAICMLIMLVVMKMIIVCEDNKG